MEAKTQLTSRDRWFYATLAAAALAVVWLFWPYANALLFAAVTTVVTWGPFEWVLAKTGGRRTVASVITLVLIALLVFVPAVWLLYIFSIELNVMVSYIQGQTREFDNLKALQDHLFGYTDIIEATIAKWNVGGLLFDQTEDWVKDQLSLDGDLLMRARSSLLQGLSWLGSSIPSVLSGAVQFSIEAGIYLFAVVVFYIEGPAVLRVFRNLSPLNPRYLDKLFGVFAEFSRNVVVGSIATAAIQGVVAAIGYLLVGLSGVVVLGIFTAVTGFVPVVGTLAVWGPVALYVAATGGLYKALFVVVWSVLFTGSIDNVVRPLFMRGSTNIHAFLIFLAVFGGMAWMGLPGALVGPVIVAMFIALYQIYLQDYKGISVKPPKPVHRPSMSMRLASRLLGTPKEPHDP